ncbi:MAG: 23S rRNA (pseudouridine(1915)-N(3))-methyltransferase RlmH [Patescibacteria group bacterium]
MLKILLLAVGELPSGGFQEIGDNFIHFLKKYASFETRSYKTPKALLEKALDGSFLLDERGTQYSSQSFAALLTKYEDRGDTFTLILGGPDGFTATEKQRFQRISLSPMTTTHDIAHVFILEQLFRGLSIVHGSSYHRDEPR